MFKFALIAASLLACAAVTTGGRMTPGSDRSDTPRYDAVGRLLVPADYREWVFLSSGIDMSYSERAAASAAHVFDNVFAPPPTVISSEQAIGRTRRC